MTREVLERDNQDNPTVILFTETPEDVLAVQQELQEQSDRAAEVARSLSTI
jgi:hypothetical protein